MFLGVKKQMFADGHISMVPLELPPPPPPPPLPLMSVEAEVDSMEGESLRRVRELIRRRLRRNSFPFRTNRDCMEESKMIDTPMLFSVHQQGDHCGLTVDFVDFALVCSSPSPILQLKRKWLRGQLPELSNGIQQNLASNENDQPQQII